MNAEAIITVSALVVALSTLIKWAAPGDSISGVRALLLVFLLSGLGVGAWVFSLATTVDRTWTFGILSAWAAVATSAAGVFGFASAATNGSK